MLLDVMAAVEGVLAGTGVIRSAVYRVQSSGWVCAGFIAWKYRLCDHERRSRSALCCDGGLLAFRGWRCAIGFLDKKSASDIGGTVPRFPDGRRMVFFQE